MNERLSVLSDIASLRFDVCRSTSHDNSRLFGGSLNLHSFKLLILGCYGLDTWARHGLLTQDCNTSVHDLRRLIKRKLVIWMPRDIISDNMRVTEETDIS